ncbi:ZYRO0G18942p [Zygosaccharomyces rouxii]|uniref:ZYRO0G18942p n=1 Tax=Zygosaccharomyces rouxii (strain ATCC 2623 / CBS 732 / NBRC 1130 / NCYC 568 / NRRL Y-229) TaxID=559307 RepID=C5E187_ZYGRC|nr:uncharacterized protein ZYRO0G18942g [Zygosaccharomyces rouxii]KAH9202864.1 hypothetical protein LQ764DRAFT_222973 [Zygosaccharomyces rouxii]CAR29871.1 ZYRO0G18942p [Zygosaccharomyces rouxii]
MPPRELPGFIFDESRGRYFPITSTNQNPNASRYNREDIKRRKIDNEKKLELANLKAKQSERYQEYWPQLFDPYEKVFGQRDAFNFIGGIERERYGYDKTDHTYQANRSGPIQLDFKDCSIFPYICHSGSTNLIVSTRNTIFKLPVNGHEPDALIRVYYARTLEGRSFDPSYGPEALIKRFDLDPDTRKAFVHLYLTETNIHHFGIEHLEHLRDTPHWCRAEFKSNENVHDAVNVGTDVVVALNNKIAVIPWDSSLPRMVRVLDKKNKSDILSLAVNDSDLGSRFLYAGCRDGSIYTIPFDENLIGQPIAQGTNSGFDFKAMRKIKFPNIKLIISIKPFKDEGMVAVSGIMDTNSQALFVLDVLSDPCQMVIKLQTSFCNLTRDKEIFEITSDGHYICYGTRAGKGDFELFSTHVDDNLVIKSSKPRIYYPLISKSSQFFIGINHTHVRAAGFGYYVDDWKDLNQKGRLRLFVAMELERRDDGISSTIISTSL